MLFYAWEPATPGGALADWRAWVHAHTACLPAVFADSVAFDALASAYLDSVAFDALASAYFGPQPRRH